MAPSAISPPLAPTLLTAPVSSLSSLNTKYSDWRADLQKHGFTVVKGAIPRERAVEYQKRAFSWLTSFSTELDIAKPETWTAANLPVQSKINTFKTACVAHERFMWDARLEPGVIAAFAKLWGTEDLLVSFDALNVTFPNRKDGWEARPAWEHVDQSPLRRGVHCVQGIINLSEAGPTDGGLIVYPGSQALHDEFFDSRSAEEKAKWDSKDVYMFKKEELDWFEKKGLKPLKVCAEPGDLILWDSRTIHYGSEPETSSNTIRTVIYAAYTPARLASEETLALRKQVFEAYEGTSHWPHDNINRRDKITYLEDGTRDPRDRDEPIEKPILSDKLLKLAGVLKY